MSRLHSKIVQIEAPVIRYEEVVVYCVLARTTFEPGVPAHH